MIECTRTEFERLVAEALDGLPRHFRDRIRNVAVLVEDFPSPEILGEMGIRSRWDLLGLYQGVPFEHRGPGYGNMPPDVILIFQKPIERIAGSPDEVRDQVRITVLHELGHYFGFDDAELRDIESESRRRGKDASHEPTFPRDLPRPHHPVRRRRSRRPPVP